MMMPENIELRIKDLTTLSDCIEKAKVCLSICQPSSLVSRMTTLTVAPSEPTTSVRQRSPSMRRNQTNSNSQNRQSRQRQRQPILKRSTFQGFRQYPGNVKPCSLSNQGIIFLILDSDHFQDPIPDLDLEVSINQLNVIIVTAWVTQQTIVSDVRIRIFHADNPTKVGETILEILNDIQITERIPDIGLPMFPSAELIFQNHQCIQIYREGINDKRRFSGSHVQTNFRSY